MKLKKTFKGDQEMDRREFIIKAGLAGIGGFALLAGCAGPNQDITNPEEFSMEKFLGWYQRNRLYNRPNPNLKSPHRPTPHPSTNFKDSMDRRVTPGLGYSVPVGEVMVAAAPGEVYMRGGISGTGRAEGWYTSIGPSKGKDGLSAPYRFNYSHTDEPFVQIHQKVERGQPIAKVPRQFSEFAKMFFNEYENYVDPDNYGFNHSYMAYQTGPIPEDEEYKSDPGIVLRRYEKQVTLLNTLNENRTEWEKGPCPPPFFS